MRIPPVRLRIKTKILRGRNGTRTPDLTTLKRSAAYMCVPLHQTFACDSVHHVFILYDQNVRNSKKNSTDTHQYFIFFLRHTHQPQPVNRSRGRPYSMYNTRPVRVETTADMVDLAWAATRKVHETWTHRSCGRCVCSAGYLFFYNKACTF